MMTLDREHSPATLIGVGVVGASSTSRFLCERLSLRNDLRLVAVHGIENSGAQLPPGSTALDVSEAPDVRVIHFAVGSSSQTMLAALAGSKSIIVESPHMLASDELEELARTADRYGQIAAIYEPRRWDRDFLQARSVLENGRLGKLLRLRYSVHDSCLPGELFPLGIAKELGSHVLDQMLQLIGPIALNVQHGSEPSVVWRYFPSARDHSEGFAASFEFSEDVTAMVEIQTRSLLGTRSGWMVEGTAGAYRNGSLFTRTSDGEIVDEPLPAPTVSSDPFLDALSDKLRGNSADLPTVRDAIRVAALLFNRSTDTPRTVERTGG